MKFPQLPVPKTRREITDSFSGYNHNPRTRRGEFYDMMNMTSDWSPTASPRACRTLLTAPKATHGLIAKDALCWVDGSSFVINGKPIDMGLTDGKKTLVSMGAYVIIMPDKKYINTIDQTDLGNIEASWESSQDVTMEMSRADGTVYEGAVASDKPPEKPTNQQLWIDTAGSPHVLKQFSEATSMWVTVKTTYVKISSPGIGKPFEEMDGVTISGINGEMVKDLNSTTTIWSKGDDFIVVVGLIDYLTSQSLEDGKITVERKMPEIDFLIESQNRLWGCRYGTAANGDIVNEIYASKLGDFKNWNSFIGVSTDSYAVSCGTDGPWTGAVNHMGYPLFFKENHLHKVYGSYPANYQVQDTACRGVQKGCSGSLAVVNEMLFYKGRNGVYAYDGSLPVEASSALGNEAYFDAVAGAYGNKYYINMRTGDGEWVLFVFDTGRNMWHKEDGIHVDSFCSVDGSMFCIESDTGKIIDLVGKSGSSIEEQVPWSLETGIIGLSTPDQKYVSRLTIRMSMQVGSIIHLFVKYDSEKDWTPVSTIEGMNLRSFDISIRPHRCDHMSMKFEGIGHAKIYSVAKTIEDGSDVV